MNVMLAFPLFSPLLLAAVASDERLPPDGDSSAAVALVGRSAVSILPEGLRDFFSPQLDMLLELPEEGSLASNRKRVGDPVEACFLMLDSGLPGSAGPAAEMPRDEQAARAMFARYGKQAVGRLPWALEEHHRMLLSAFREQDTDAVMRESAAIIRLSAAAGLPFNTTVNHDGHVTGHLAWAPDRDETAAGAHRTVRHRYHKGLIERYRERFAFEVQVIPQRYRPIADPLGAAFEVLRRSHGVANELLDADRAVVGELQIDDCQSFMGRRYEYYERLMDRTGWIIEARLEDGAVLAGGLIGTAWEEAAKPLLVFRGAPEGTAAPFETTTAAEKAVEPPQLVASKGSKVFHLSTCHHVRRISSANLIRFATVEEAIASGRKPCKSCNPDADSASKEGTAPP